MRPIAAIVPASLLLAAAAALSACGGSGGLSRSEATERAGTICREATADARRFASGRPAPKSAADVSVAVQRDIGIARRAEEKLKKLDPPSEGRASFDRFVAAQGRIVKANRDQLAASRASDPDRFQASVDALLAATGDAKKAADAYRLRGCPYLPVAVQLQRAAGGAAGGVVGRWEGEVTQYEPGQKTSRYGTVMTVTADRPGAPAGTIRYPSLDCGGELQLSTKRGTRRVYREQITDRPDRCSDGGTIFADVKGETMSWRWVQKRIEVLGTLRRAG